MGGRFVGAGGYGCDDGGDRLSGLAHGNEGQRRRLPGKAPETQAVSFAAGLPYPAAHKLP